MSAPPKSTVTAVVVATFDGILKARATARTVSRHGGARCVVIDVDGRYQRVEDEDVVPLAVALEGIGCLEEAALAAAAQEPSAFAFYAGAVGACYAASTGSGRIVVLGSGVLVLGDLGAALAHLSGFVVVPGTDATAIVRRLSVAEPSVRRESDTGLLSLHGSDVGPLYSHAFYAVGTAGGEDVTARLRELAADWRLGTSALDILASTSRAGVAAGSMLISPWRAVGETTVDQSGRLTVDGSPVPLVDLTAFDVERPWTLAASSTVNPMVLLSDHPALFAVVEQERRERRRDAVALSTVHRETATPARARIDSTLRSELRRAIQQGERLPDLMGSAGGDELERWALELVPPLDRRPVARYLLAVRLARPDLQRAFKQVPGPDSAKFARWVADSDSTKPGLDAGLMSRAAEITRAAQPAANDPARGPLPDGVNLVGYLAGELGLGESARLVHNALLSANVPVSTVDVSSQLGRRSSASYSSSESRMRRTSVICVNAPETAAAAPRLANLLKRTRVIGMWYWELASFPSEHGAAFALVDEVWAATDFVRDAIAEQAPPEVLVRTVMPPLPQALGNAGSIPARFAIPQDRPWFLFAFDFFSVADRKNPYGLVEAFTRAFGGRPMSERPLLVIKTINADHRPEEAERLRLLIAGRSDVLFIDSYLDHDQRHALVARCTAFVSLHRAEGLGLTIAEAMAWGRPVITTAYGGVMQFCDEENSFLVDYQLTRVTQTAGPYVEGSLWADPDLDMAAQVMREVIDNPQRAVAIGRQAAADVRNLHNEVIAGAHMRKILNEGDERWAADREAARAARRTAQGAGQARVRPGVASSPPVPRQSRVGRRVRLVTGKLRRRFGSTVTRRQRG